MSELKSQIKPFEISQREVWAAYLKVKSNQGAPGVDGCTIEEFEKDLQGNLYQIWNRMSSGSYFPPPVKAVDIPKPHGGGVRILGVPTVADRVAQTVVARRLEDKVEPIFHPDAYGYRPNRSQLDAVAACRQRCWTMTWAIDLDVSKFFDSVRWDLVLKAVKVHTDATWVLLYVQRWLAAPRQLADGTLRQRDRGTPQGSAVSPVLANLFLHYAVDLWLSRSFPGVQFERYADDAVVHCVSERQARVVLAALGDRMNEVGLPLHPTKTRIVYCGQDNGQDGNVATSFTFLGFTFRRRPAQDRQGRIFTSFLPAVSTEALKKMSAQLRSWRLHRHIDYTFTEFARWINPIVRGWMQYYGAFYKTELYPLLRRINYYLMRWVRKKYRRLKTFKKFHRRWKQITKMYPLLFAHWKWVHSIW
jgi:RNA-directed DNA polymerase